MISAAEALFNEGFPDPRGCEYREVVLTVSSVWNNHPQEVTTRAWVLPAVQGVNVRYAICWNGLIYPVLKVGMPADLHQDVTNLVPPNSRRFNAGLGEILSVLPTNSPSSRVILLLRCGEVETAVNNWVPDKQIMFEALSEMKLTDAGTGNIEKYDPYLELAQDWAWAQFDHVICAHMRGDVALALAGSRKLAELQPRIESEAERRGFAHPGYNDSSKHDKPALYLNFLAQLPQLLADLERRANEPAKMNVAIGSITNISDRSQRIAALIDDLDQVQALQLSQPGMVMPEEDPIVQALIKEGDGAVEPLMDCLEHDKRLTRSVGYSRNFHRDRVVISVASAARAALREILQVQFRDVTEFRAYWNNYKGLSLEDRWYSTLADDSAGAGQWLQAARNIMQPANIVGVPGSGHYITVPLEPGKKAGIRGEVLRDKQNPSVTELLLKRSDAIGQKAAQQDQSVGVEGIGNGCEFVTILSEW
ncbi:MAG TPA: hypothetical protein VN048_07350, partial [Verrucomicrobiae bacterium]|nr:hypothetical protein [Verrucomicrobiae bacterium]